MSKDTIRLGDLCTIVMGQSPDSSSYNTSGHGMPFFQGNADFGKVSPTAKTWCTDPKKTASAGDLLISVRAPIGALNIADQECCIGRGLSAIRPDSHLASSRFLWHFLAHIRPQIEARGTGSTFKAINKSSLGDIPVPVYPLQEQEAIAEKLDTVSQVMADLSETRQQLDCLVKSQFVEMFGNPVSNQRKWQIKPLWDVAPVSPSSTVIQEPFWMLNLDKVESGTGNILQYDLSTYKDLGNSVSRFDQENVLYSKLRPNLNKVVLPDRAGYCTSELLVLKPVKGVLNRVFLAHLLRTNQFVAFASTRVTGAKMPRIDMSAFHSYPCIIPPLALQEEFARLAEQADKSQFAIKQVIEKLGTLKGSLMQRYFG